MKLRNVILLFLLNLTFWGWAQNATLKDSSKNVDEYGNELPPPLTPDQEAVNLGMEMYGFGDKKDALDVFIQAVDLNENNADANYMAGVCYLETVHKHKSIPYLKKAYSVNPNIEYDVLYLIGKGYQIDNQYDSAIVYFNKFKEGVEAGKLKDDKHTKEQLLAKVAKRNEECEYSKEILRHKTPYKVKPLSKSVNTEYPEYSPFLTADENTLVFTSKRKGSTGNFKDVDNEFFEDIYITIRKDTTWSEPHNLGAPINTKNHEGCVGISPDGKDIYVFEESNGGDIYISSRSDTGWTKPKSFSHKINSHYYEPSLCINHKKDMVFFSSDRAGGKGKLDLYISHKNAKGEWETPINVSDLNTPEQEDSPFFDDHTNTLYFSSAGHKGLGGYDIFKTHYDSLNHKWSTPENMGSPINTPDDDIYFVVSEGGKRGYFSTVRDEGEGDKDIYVVEILPDTNALTTKDTLAKDSLAQADSLARLQQLANAKSNKNSLTDGENSSNQNDNESGNANNLNGSTKNGKNKNNGGNEDGSDAILKTFTFNVKTKDRENKNDLENVDVEIVDANGKVLYKGKTNKNGEITATIPNKKGNKHYDITAVSKGHMFTSEIVKLDETKDSYDVSLNMRKLEVGYVEVLRHVYYDFNKSTLKPESFNELDKVVKLLTQNPYLHLKINGHTDNVGSHEFNISLSQRRSQSVIDYLVSKGINPTRLKAKGYGETKPIASNDDEEEGRELNRRTEVEVIK
ncbi:MAG: OmpA family protein [Cytophagales bacterium]